MIRRTKQGIYRTSNAAILPKSGTMFLMDSNPREDYRQQQSKLPTYVERYHKDGYMLINGFKVIPNGPNNLFPQDLKRLLDKDESMHGMLRTKIDLLLAGGIYLYEEVMEKDEAGKPVIKRYEVLDAEISDWLESWNFDHYLTSAATDFIYVENNFVLLKRNRFARFASYRDQWRMVPELIDAEDGRLEQRDNDGKINHFFIADWTDQDSVRKMASVPLIDYSNPWQYPVSGKFISFPSFASKYYGRPPYIGAVNYIELSSLIPYWHIDNLKNGDLVYHVQTSWEYWDKLFQKEGIAWDTEEAAALEDEVLAEIDAVLYSETAENAKKRIHSKFEYDDVSGKPKPSIIIDRLDEKVNERSKAYIELFRTTNEAKISGIHLDPTLANVLVDGKLSSGSEKMHAFNLHNKVVAPMPRRLILWAPNFCLRQSFPEKTLKIGFREIELNTQDKTTKGYTDITSKQSGNE